MVDPGFPFRKILVSTDFSDGASAALARAAGLAEKTGAGITLVHVLEHVSWAVAGTSFEAHWRLPPEAVHQAERRLRRESDDRLAQLIKAYQNAGREVRTQTLTGVAYVEIIRLCRSGGYDLVIAGTRGISGLKRVLVGSTAERLVRNCPCPVWVVKPASKEEPRSILAPIDLSSVTRKSLEVAAALSRLFRCPLDVLHAVDFRVDTILEPPSEFGAVDSRVRRREISRAAGLRLHEIVENHVPAEVAVREHLALGAPWDRITAAARRTKADLIVMGSVGRTGIPGFVIGNTAEKVLRRCDCSILTVKPDGFVSPIQK
jgi:nucleotide-binding universal stress UspA family protein